MLGRIRHVISSRSRPDLRPQYRPCALLGRHLRVGPARHWRRGGFRPLPTIEAHHRAGVSYRGVRTDANVRIERAMQRFAKRRFLRPTVRRELRACASLRERGEARRNACAREGSKREGHLRQDLQLDHGIVGIRRPDLAPDARLLVHHDILHGLRGDSVDPH